MLSMAMVRETHWGEAGSGGREMAHHVRFVIIATHMEHMEVQVFSMEVLRWLNLIGEQTVTHRRGEAGSGGREREREGRSCGCC